MEIVKLKAPNIFFKANSKPNKKDLSKLNVNLKKYKNLKSQIEKIYSFYKIYEKHFLNFPIYCKFNKLLGKTHRFLRAFKKNEFIPLKQIDSKYIFNQEQKIEDKIHIVYSCSLDQIQKTLNEINILIDFIHDNQNVFNQINKITFSNENLTVEKKNEKIYNLWDGLPFRKNKTLIQKLLLDFNYLYSVEIPKINLENNKSLIKFYNIDSFENIQKKLKKFNINIDSSVVSSSRDMIMNLDYYLALDIQEKIPFLIATASNNSIKFLNEFGQSFFLKKNKNQSSMLSIPNNLKTHRTPIGVIDSYAKFSNGWENYIEIENRELQYGDPNYEHGTSVSSIIIANDYINDYFKDDLGYFKVKHFGILNQTEIDLTFAMKEIEYIISKNHKKIKIWNLSIDVSGGKTNSISEFGKFLDRIQNEYDVLLVVSTGNEKEICQGSDSLSAISVGALYEKNDGSLQQTKYSGKSKIFNRFDKPNTFDIGNDISAFDKSDNNLWMLESNGYIDTGLDGTSFAAPLVTRKCGFLYDEYGFSLETIRAIINLQSTLAERKEQPKRANINFKNLNIKNEKFLIIEGEICPKNSFFEFITLPHINKKRTLYKDYHLAISTSYKVSTFQNVGDEYSSIEIKCKIISDDVLPEEKNKSINSIKTNSNSIDGVNATEKELLDHFQKYNPNKVLIDENFWKNTYIRPFKTKTNKLKLQIICQSLFDQPLENIKVKYGITILLKGIEQNSLDSFIEANSHIITKVFHEINLAQEISVIELNEKLNTVEN